MVMLMVTATGPTTVPTTVDSLVLRLETWLQFGFLQNFMI